MTLQTLKKIYNHYFHSSNMVRLRETLVNFLLCALILGSEAPSDLPNMMSRKCERTVHRG